MIANTLMRAAGREPERSSYDPQISLAQWAQMVTQFGFNGTQYTISGEAQEPIGGQFRALAQLAYRSNGVVFACMAVRMLLFAEARFQWQRLQNGRPGDLFGDQELGILEKPWPNGTTGDLLSRQIQHADLAGNWFATVRNGQVKVLRPDWMGIVIGSDDPSIDEVDPWSTNAELVGYVYTPGGIASGNTPERFLPDEVAHFAPYPDPEARYRGMSWLTPIVREVMADKAVTEHKLKFFENAATPNLFVSLKEPDLAKFKGWMEAFREQHEGVENAYRTLFLGAGADATVVGANLQQLEFKVTQGAGETRIAAAAGVPPVIVGLSEGLAAATYSNYELAMRRFADLTMRPLWRNAAGSLESILKVPGGARLWYDDRDIPALAEDQKKQAETQQAQAMTIRTLVDSGFNPDDVVTSVMANDFSKLAHSGLYSVQLQPAGTTPKQGLLKGTAVPIQPGQGEAIPAGSPPALNGTGAGRDLVPADSREE